MVNDRCNIYEYFQAFPDPYSTQRPSFQPFNIECAGLACRDFETSCRLTGIFGVQHCRGLATLYLAASQALAT